jgi:hypothetical protein
MDPHSESCLFAVDLMIPFLSFFVLFAGRVVGITSSKKKKKSNLSYLFESSNIDSAGH